MRLILLAILLTVAGAGYSTLNAQDRHICVADVNRKGRHDLIPSCPAAWKRIAIHQLSFCVPDEFAVQHRTTKGDSRRFQYESDKLKFSIDYSDSAWRPSVERRSSSYRENVIEASPITFWIWSVENRAGWRYVNGLNVWNKKTGSYTAGMFVLSNTEAGPELSPQLFNSLCYGLNSKQTDDFTDANYHFILQTSEIR